MVGGKVVLGLLSICYVGFTGFKSAPNPEAYKVQYHVKCEECHVTFSDEKGEKAEIPAVKKDWTYKFTGNPGQIAFVSATNDVGTPVVVVIIRGGEELIESTSEEKNVDAKASVVLQNKYEE